MDKCSLLSIVRWTLNQLSNVTVGIRPKKKKKIYQIYSLQEQSKHVITSSAIGFHILITNMYFCLCLLPIFLYGRQLPQLEQYRTAKVVIFSDYTGSLLVAPSCFKAPAIRPHVCPREEMKRIHIWTTQLLCLSSPAPLSSLNLPTLALSFLRHSSLIPS